MKEGSFTSLSGIQKLRACPSVLRQGGADWRFMLGFSKSPHTVLPWERQTGWGPWAVLGRTVAPHPEFSPSSQWCHSSYFWFTQAWGLGFCNPLAQGPVGHKVGTRLSDGGAHAWTPYCQIQTQIEESRGNWPFRYDLNQIPYNYTVEVTNRFRGLDLLDRVPEELWTEVHDIVLEAGIKTIPKEKKCKKAKWLSNHVLLTAEKRRETKGEGEKER